MLTRRRWSLVLIGLLLASAAVIVLCSQFGAVSVQLADVLNRHAQALVRIRAAIETLEGYIAATRGA